MMRNLKAMTVALVIAAVNIISPLAAEETVVVGIDKNTFMPSKVTIKVGGVVTWVNNEKRTSHSVLFGNEDALESERLMPGDTWQRRFDTPGVYAYSCGPHPEMKGSVEVQP